MQAEMIASAQVFRTSTWARAGWVALALYILYAASRLEITWARFMVGLDNGAKFIGGIGGTLFSAFQRFDYDFVCAILLCIIGMIMAGEVVAGWVRAVFLERGKIEEERVRAVSGRAAAKTWERFTPARRLARFGVYLALAIAIVASARTVEIIPEFLYDAPEQMQDLLARMWPIAFYHYRQGVHDALMDTLHITYASMQSEAGWSRAVR